MHPSTSTITNFAKALGARFNRAYSNRYRAGGKRIKLYDMRSYDVETIARLLEMQFPKAKVHISRSPGDITVSITLRFGRVR